VLYIVGDEYPNFAEIVMVGIMQVACHDVARHRNGLELPVLLAQESVRIFLHGGVVRAGVTWIHPSTSSQ
jgi:hypothetical protein